MNNKLKKKRQGTEKKQRQKETRDKYFDTLLCRTGWMLTGKAAPDWPAKQADTKNDKEIMKYGYSY